MPRTRIAPPGIRVALAAALVALIAPAAGADSCRWLAAAEAERALALARQADAWMSFGTVRPEPLASSTLRQHDGGSAELLLDGRAVDVSDLYLRLRERGWIALGREVAGCGSSRLPVELVAAPFAALARDEQARLAEPPSLAWHALAELPSVLPQWEDHPRAPVTVWAAPRQDASPVTVVESADELPTTEWGYERGAAYVVEERPEWVRIRLREGSGWVRRADAGVVHPLSGLLLESLTYLSASWNGLLYAEPGERAGVARIDEVWRRRLFEPDEVPVDVVASREVRGALWIELRVTSRSCADGRPPYVWAEGWVPLAGTDGEPTVAFSSRGC